MGRMPGVLIVEDEADINETICASLRLTGLEARGVLNGADALEDVERFQPDLVVLDQMLPDIDGREICRKLRASPATATIPIIFLTARAGAQERVLGLESGADDYMTKPFSMRELTLRIRALLRRSSAVPSIRFSPTWLHCREQFRVWDTYANIHLSRGEWRECEELCRSILRHCEAALSGAERCLLFSRLARCAEKLGDREQQRTWQERAHAEAVGVSPAVD